jgi:raffinose/stachyose/melibiose transport system substrate-binding protein
MKRIFSVLLVVAIVAMFLAGCGNKSPSGSTKDGNVTVTFLCSGVKATSGEDFRLESLPRIIKETYPNLTVETTLLPDDQYYTALKTKLATGEAPDLLWVQPRWAGSNAAYALAEAGYLADLNGMKAIELVGSGADSFTYNGVTYGIPAGVTYLGTYYNKDIFAQHNLEIPTNWQEFLNVCETLKNAGVQPIIMGDKDMYVMQFALYQLAANMIYPNNPTYDNQLREGTVKFTDKGTWDKVIERYGDLYSKGYVQTGSLGLGISQAQQRFNNGQAAMIFDGTFNKQAISGDNFKRGYFPLPGNDAGQPLYVAGAPGVGPAIYANSPYINECKQILELWFDGKSDLYTAYETCGRFISTHKGAQVDPLYALFMEQYYAGNSWYWCNQAWPAGTENEMEALFGEMIGGAGTTVDQVVAGMQRKFEELLNK